MRYLVIFLSTFICCTLAYSHDETEEGAYNVSHDTSGIYHSHHYTNANGEGQVRHYNKDDESYAGIRGSWASKNDENRKKEIEDKKNSGGQTTGGQTTGGQATGDAGNGDPSQPETDDDNGDTTERPRRSRATVKGDSHANDGEQTNNGDTQPSGDTEDPDDTDDTTTTDETPTVQEIPKCYSDIEIANIELRTDPTHTAITFRNTGKQYAKLRNYHIGILNAEGKSQGKIFFAQRTKSISHRKVYKSEFAETTILLFRYKKDYQTYKPDRKKNEWKDSINRNMYNDAYTYVSHVWGIRNFTIRSCTRFARYD